MHQNFIVCGTELICKIHPLKILKVRLTIFSMVALMSPILLNNISNTIE